VEHHLVQNALLELIQKEVKFYVILALKEHMLMYKVLQIVLLVLLELIHMQKLLLVQNVHLELLLMAML
jgi:hypothetical protein